MIFLAKKIISPFLNPLSAGLLMALVGVLFLWFTRRQKTGKVLVTISTLLLGFFSYGAVSDMLAKSLEKGYAPLTDYESLKNIKWIVVLSGDAVGGGERCA